MVTGPAAIVIVVVFVITGGVYGVRLLLGRTLPERILDTSHLLMAVLMILMPSGLSMQVPALPQLIVFSGFAIWYVYLALFRPTVADGLGDHHAGRPRLVYHALMMLAMAGMAVIMAPLPTPAGASGSMPGMSDMPGMSGHEHSGSGPAVPGSHPWADPWMILIGMGFGVAAIWYLGRFLIFVRDPAAGHTGRLVRHLTDALMAFGMALTFLVVKT
ncbi:DUF5134 domain-containing protein [Microlunatus soli]|uniref:DUF5134 domain-containing protein n=1 Tax=Microlunatus soli TaxID=630515 RepID=A0A1H1MUQ0_9ACTN|nr:DUF5134 domain-containing protein [Microlunatus soli]SDR90155.1 hypothetical protein SAMN04489812_0260 [Microlunatus soli]